MQGLRLQLLVVLAVTKKLGISQPTPLLAQRLRL